MEGLSVAFIASFLLGTRHATDADHVIAITSIVNGDKAVSRSTRIGILWGIGHSLTILMVGGAIILLKLAFTPRLGLSMEFCVALMLMLLGYLNLRGHTHTRSQAAQMRPFFVGIVHGLAGSAAATLLIIPLIPDPRWAFLYLSVFGIGTIAGMAMITALVAAPATYAGSKIGDFERHIRLASGTVSLLFGVYLAYRIGFVDGLFTAAPSWTPL
jgi:high-affinity nickel-transport protein